MRTIFTDLHGTLLDAATNDWSLARPALLALQHRNVPVVMVSSKTRAEVEMWRDQMANRHPFIVENGAAVFIQQGYFNAPVEGARNRRGYEMLVLGSPGDELAAVLKAAAREAAVVVRTLDQMTDAEIQQRTALPLDQVTLVRRREFGMPFVLEHDEDADRLRRAIETRGKRYTRGGRFHHILGANDKRRAVKMLLGLFRRRLGSVHALGLGDGLNDLGFLAEMDAAVIMQSARAEKMRETLPNAYVTQQPGPAGWNEAVTRLVLDAAASA